MFLRCCRVFPLARIQYWMLLPALPLSVLADPLLQPFATSNRNPFVQVYGLPVARSAELVSPGQVATGLVLEAANSFTLDDKRGEQIVIDGETHRAQLSLRRGFDAGWEIGVELPWLSHEGGGLDSFIDNWHSAFGLPDGDRPDYPSDRLHYSYSLNGQQQVNVSRSSDGIGDISLTAGYSLASSNTRQWALRTALKLPTGDADKLTGSESTDIALALHLSDSGWLDSHDLLLHGSAGVLRIEGGDVLDAIREDWVLYGSATLAWLATDNTSLKIQFDAHTAFYDSALTELGSDSAQLTLGGSVKLGEDWTVDLSVIEDIAVDTAPDVVFMLGLRTTRF